MKVKDLKRRLEQFDDEAEVKVVGSDFYSLFDPALSYCHVKELDNALALLIDCWEPARMTTIKAKITS